MRLSFNIRLRLLAFFLIVGAVLTLTSCSDDDIGYDVGINEVKEVTVRLNISAGLVGDISVTRADDDENALTGEYMNSLCVFVVDENDKIVARFESSPNDDDYDWGGETPEWTSEDFTLETGSYTVYAFSNWETVTNDQTGESEWLSIINKSEGETLEADDLNIDIDDPASKVNIDQGNYIPMSGMLKIDVKEGSTSFDVGMNRLVGRVEITIYGESGSGAEDVILNSFTFGNLANIVPLMSGGTVTDEDSFSGEYKKDFDDITLTAVDNGEEANSEKFYFYVNETSNTTGFDISLSTTRESGESSYTATTETKEIPRNYILPIYLSLSTYTLDLTVNAYAGPIGAEERQYSNIEQETEDTYTVTLATVTTWFTMTPSLLGSDGNAVSGVTWEWTTSENGQLSTNVSEDDDYTLTASGLTATNGYKYSFDLTAKWTSTSGVDYERTFHINIVLDNYQPNYNRSFARSSWQGWYWNKEKLNMYRIH